MFLRLAGFIASKLRKLGTPLLLVAVIVGTFAVVSVAARIQAGQQIGPGPDPTPVYSRRPYNDGVGAQPSPSSSVPDTQHLESQLALRFTAAFLDTSGGKQAWLGRMSPIANPSFIDALSTTDLANVPKGHLTGPDGGFVSLTPTRHYDALVQVHTTSGDLLVYVARRNMSDEWWINSIEPAA